MPKIGSQSDLHGKMNLNIPVPSWAPLNHLALLPLLCVDLLCELAEDVVYLVVDGQSAANTLWPAAMALLPPPQSSPPVLGLGLRTRSLPVVILACVLGLSLLF